MKCLQYCFQYCFAQRPMPGLLNSRGWNLLCSAAAESDTMKTALWQLRSRCCSICWLLGLRWALLSSAIVANVCQPGSASGVSDSPKPEGPMSEALNTTWRRDPVQLGLLVPYSPLLVAMRPGVGVP